MPVPDLGVHLRGRLGPDASDDLSDALEEIQNDIIVMTTDRLEARLEARLAILGSQLRSELGRAQAELRQDIICGDASLRVAFTEGLSRIRAEIADTRVDVLRWSLVFWLGQVIATATLLALMLPSR